MRVCRQCGNPIPPTRKSNSEYCSQKCNQRAYRARKKAERQSGESGGAVRRPGKVTVRVSPTVNAELTRDEFNSMMDDSYEDLLRFSRDVLKKAAADDMTAGRDKAAIVKQLLEVGKELDMRSGNDDLLAMRPVNDEVVSDEFRAEAV